MELTGKRILIIVENLSVPFDRRVWQEATSLHNHGADVFIICPRSKNDKKHETLNGIHIYRHPLPKEGNGILGYLIEYITALFWEFYLAFKIYFSHKFQILHACNPPDLIFLVALPFKLLGVKFIFDHHDINPELYLAKFEKKNFFYYLMILFEKLTFKSANASIATNESYKEMAIQRGKMRPDQVYIVRSGPNLNRMKQTPHDESLKYGKSILIGYVGVIGQQEGVDHLLEALTILIQKFKFTDFHCTICGSGPAFGKMQRLADQLNLNNFVNFTGRIPDEQLLSILNTTDICVNPDVWNEMNDKSTMNKVMEYMALGKPIVQYELKEGRFSAQKASLYANPNDRNDFAKKILILIQDKNLRNKMGTFGKHRIKQELNWDIEEPKLIELYRTIS